MTNTVLPRIEAQSLTQKVQATLREHILSGQLRPGSRLVESQLAEQLGVSRAPVREALLALEGEGWVVSAPGKGTMVVDLTEEDLREIYTLRTVLEGLAMRLATARIDAEGLEQLSDIVEQMKLAGSAGDAERVALQDLEFHRAIWRLAGHQRLQSMLNSITVQTRIFLALNAKAYDDLLDNCMEHVELLDALRAHSADHAAGLMTQHIGEAGELTIRYFRRIEGAPDL